MQRISSSSKADSRRTGSILIAALTFVLTGSLASAGTDPAAKCVDAKLKASGQAIQKILGCHAKAIGKGEAVDMTCLTKNTTKLTGKLAKAESKGGCLTSGDGVRFLTAVDVSTGQVLAELVDDPMVASKCTSTKIKAAGKRAAKVAKAHGGAVKKASSAKLGSSIIKASTSFDKALTKGDAAGDCHTTVSGAQLAGVTDGSLDALFGLAKAVDFETITTASQVEVAETPGTTGVDANNYPNLVSQLGAAVNLNNVTYTRFYYQPDGVAPDAILILIPGFEGGAQSFKVLAENAVSRAMEDGTRLEVWAYDRRGHQMEDLVGTDIAEADQDAQLALEWYYGAELGLPLDSRITRNAIFHDPHADTAFMANWTSHVFSQDIDTIVEAAGVAAANGNVFLGGHSAGSGYLARYAATDLDEGAAVEAGYAKLRGLVLIEGGGGSSSGTAPTADELDLIEDRADGGLFYAVRDDAPRCVDGFACTTNADCVGRGKEKCVEPTEAYAIVDGLLNPRILAAGEVSALQAVNDPDTGENLITVDQGSGSAIALVPDLSILALLGNGTAYGGLGAFVDDDGFVSSAAPFVRTSVGAAGPTVGGLNTWQHLGEGPMPASALVDNGPAPTTLPGVEWGVEREVTRMDRLIDTFFAGQSNFTDWYYPSGGLSTTSGLPSLDSSALSVGRSRPDIVNITEAANINIPVICVGASNGLTSVPGDFVAFAGSIGTCTAPSCDGTTPRVVDALVPNEAFPTLGGEAGGFEVFITEGMAHVDIVTAEDDAQNQVVGPLLAFIERNSQ